MWQRRKKNRTMVNGEWLIVNGMKRQTSNVKRQTFQIPNSKFPSRTSYILLLTSYFLLLTSYFLLSCNSPYIPKPTGYFKINLPEKKYQQFNQQNYPYTFEYPVYARVVKDSTFFGDSTENPW